MRIFEVDRAEVIDFKESVLSQLGAVTACDRRLVRADLNDNWVDALLDEGFVETEPTVVLIEGLTPYLAPDRVRALFTDISRVAPVGSCVGVDFVGVSFLNSPVTQAYLSRLSLAGVPWLFGSDTPARLLENHGWRATSYMPGDPEANFGRWPFQAKSNDLVQLPRAYLVRGTREAAASAVES